jgi:hypothetical protein
MRLASTQLARAMIWMELADLIPRGITLLPMVKALASRYDFHKVPEKPEEFDEGKGITFATGRIGETAIDQLVIYTYGILLDTRASTDKSKQILEALLEWGAEEHGLTFKQQMATRWQYSSQLTFYSDVMPLGFPKALMDLSAKISHAVQESMKENLKYEPIIITIDYDPLTRKHPLGPFTIQRRDNTPFSEGKYFSSAPLTTDTHIKLLESFEKSLESS